MTVEDKLWKAVCKLIRRCGNCQRRKNGFCPKHKEIGDLL